MSESAYCTELCTIVCFSSVIYNWAFSLGFLRICFPYFATTSINLLHHSRSSFAQQLWAVSLSVLS